MNGLLISPKFPPTFWSYERILALIGKRALMPPLGLITVAALLPEDWTCRLVDCNVRPVAEEDWAWADIVLLSGMIVQKTDLLSLVIEAKRRRKVVVVGGPYATALPDELRGAGADFMVLGEAETTVPPLLQDGKAVAGDVREILTGAKTTWPIKNLVNGPASQQLPADSDPRAEAGRAR